MEKKYNSKNSCKKTILYCEQAQYEELIFWKRAVMKWHIFFCPSCQIYSKKNSKLSQNIKNSKLSSLGLHEMKELKTRLTKGIRK